MKLVLPKGSYSFDRGDGWSSEAEVDEAAEAACLSTRPWEEPIAGKVYVAVAGKLVAEKMHSIDTNHCIQVMIRCLK
jgi:hypothetical protein